MMARYRLTYDASTRGDNSQVVVWEKTAEEFLTPNGPDDTLLSYMLRETDARGGVFLLERIPPACLCLFEDGVIVRTDDGCSLHSKRPGVAVLDG